MFPKLIFQTWKTKEIPEKWKKWHLSWKKYNPDYEFVFHDDNDNRNFVKKYFPSYLELYNSFHVEIYRADIVRYFFLYKYGGIYADMDFECLRPFDSLFEKYKYKEIIVGQLNNFPVYTIPNAIMVSKPGNKFWMDVIKYIDTHPRPNAPTQNRDMAPDIITGPVPLDKEYNNLTNKDSFVILDSYLFYNLDFRYVKALELQKQNIRLCLKINRAEAICKGAYAYTYWANSWYKTWC